MSDISTQVPAHGGKRILIVEDDPVLARVYQNRLTKAGFTVSLSTDGQDGFFTVMKDKPDAVLLDLMLPHIDGLQILRKTRAQKQFEKTPIIVFSNSFMNGMLQQAVEAGATMVVNKSEPGAIDNIVAGFLQLICGVGSTIKAPPPALPAEPKTSFETEFRPRFNSAATESRTPVATAETKPAVVEESKIARPSGAGRFGVIPIARKMSLAPSPVAAAPTPQSRAAAAVAKIEREPVHTTTVIADRLIASNRVSGFAPRPASSDTSIISAEARTPEKDLLEIFGDNGNEIISRIRTRMRAYSKAPQTDQGREHLQAFYRLVHSLTSAAAMASLESLANFSACLEALLHELIAKPAAFQPSTLRTLASSVDVLDRMFKEAGRYECPMMTEAFVLIVDDDVVSQRAVTLSLQKARLHVICAHDSESALESLKEISFELIVLDVNMPGLDGFEICSIIRKIPSYERTPILFVSGLTDFASRARSIAIGGTDFICKPLNRIEMTVKSLSYVMKGRLPALAEAPAHA